MQFSVYIMVNTARRGLFDMVVEVSSPGKTKKMREEWKEQGFALQKVDNKKYKVPENQSFVVRALSFVLFITRK